MTNTDLLKSIPELIAERIAYHENEIEILREQLSRITNPVTSPLVTKAIQGASFPTSAQMNKMVKDYLNKYNTTWVRTADIVNHYYGEQAKKDDGFRIDITRRISGKLYELAEKTKEIYSKNPPGQRGKVYTSNKFLTLENLDDEENK